MLTTVTNPFLADRVALKAFVQQEMKRMKARSIRDFATMTGISHITIGRMLNMTTEPTIDTILKLAKNTGTDPAILIKIVYPLLSSSGNPEALLLAHRIGQLPRAQIRLIDAFIMTLLREQDDDELK